MGPTVCVWHHAFQMILHTAEKTPWLLEFAFSLKKKLWAKSLQFLNKVTLTLGKWHNLPYFKAVCFSMWLSVITASQALVSIITIKKILLSLFQMLNNNTPIPLSVYYFCQNSFEIKFRDSACIRSTDKSINETCTHSAELAELMSTHSMTETCLSVKAINDRIHLFQDSKIVFVSERFVSLTQLDCANIAQQI